MQQEVIKKKIKEKIILDRSHAKIIAAANLKIESLEKELSEINNIEQQHKYVNGLMHKEIADLKKENEQLKKENEIIAARGNSVIDPGDKLVMFVPVKSIKKVQELLSVRLDYF